MNVKKAMHSLTQTARKVRRARKAGHLRVVRKKRANVKRRSSKLSEGARKVRAQRAKAAKLKSELLAAYRSTLANLRKVRTASVAGARKCKENLVALEALSLRYVDASGANDHSPSSEIEGDSLIDGIDSAFGDLVQTLDLALVAVRDNL